VSRTIRREGQFNWIKPKLQQDEEGWQSFRQWGITPLKTAKHIIRDYITQIYSKHLHLDGDIYRATLDPVQNLIARTRLVCIGKRWPNCPDFLQVKISLRGSNY